MSVEVAAAQELGVDQLVDGGRAQVGDPLALGRGLAPGAGHHHPPQAECRGENLARRARVDDVSRVEALERSHSGAVVAILGVVVVLDDKRAALVRPSAELLAPFRCHHGSGRKLVRRSDQDRIHLEPREAIHAEAALVHGDGDRLEARLADDLPQTGVAGVLDPDPPGAAATERVGDNAQALREPVAHDDVARIRYDMTHTAGVFGQRCAQLGRALGIAVAQVSGAERVQHPSHRAGEGRPRKEPQIGEARSEVEPDRRRVGCDRLSVVDRRWRGGDEGARAPVAGQEAFRDELVVGLDDDPARYAEIAGKRPCRGQGSAAAQATRAHRLAQPTLDLEVQRPSAALEGKEYLRLPRESGPVFSHGTGAYTRTGTPPILRCVPDLGDVETAIPPCVICVLGPAEWATSHLGIVMNWLAVLLILLSASTAHARSPVELKEFLSTHAQTPEDYIVSKFAKYDLVLIGEQHWVRQQVTLVGSLIPQLHRAGIAILAIEFARRSDQALIDSLLNATEYDEKLARRITLQGLVQWGYQEYVDLYRAAWRVNHDLSPGVPRFRILALDGSPDYSVIRKHEDLDDPHVRRRMLHGETEKDWATLLIDSVLAKRKQALVYTGLHHAFTKYAQPIVSDGALLRLEDSRFGQYLHAYAPSRIFMIAMHDPWPGEAGYDAPPVLPADGSLDKALESAGSGWQRVGFDLVGTPFGAMESHTSVYKHGHEPFTMDEFADGYVYLGPISRYEPVTPIADFVDESNIDYARANSANPADRTASIESFNRSIAASLERAKRRWGQVPRP